MSEESTQDDAFVGGSALARAIGNVADANVKIFNIEGRLKHVTFAVRWIPTRPRARATGKAVKVCIDDYTLAREDLYGEIGEAVVELETKVQILFHALVDPKRTDKPMAASTGEITDLLDPDEVEAIFDVWHDWQVQRSPIARAKNLAEIEKIVDDLGKGFRPTTSLRSYDRYTLHGISLLLVDRLSKLTKQPSSDSGQQTGSGSDSSPGA